MSVGGTEGHMKGCLHYEIIIGVVINYVMHCGFVVMCIYSDICLRMLSLVSCNCNCVAAIRNLFSSLPVSYYFLTFVHIIGHKIHILTKG